MQANLAYAMEIAITVDDIPAHGEISSPMTRVKIANQLLAALRKHQVKEVYGFINAGKLNEDKNNWEVLRNWVDEGQLLGNHTFSHTDISKVSANDYIADIENNDAVLLKFMVNKNYKYFRYPYLAEGNTQEKRDAVRAFLLANHYQMAPVTVDFFDYDWNSPYIRCLQKHDMKSIAWLKKSYIEQALNALTIAHSLSIMLFNRDIKNILLIHVGQFDALMMDELLTAYENKNVKFISLPNALTDDAYSINPNIVRDRPYTFLNQLRLAKGMKNPDLVNKLYNTLPEEKLYHLCR